jgi:uncharacterized protein (DUF697 family)
MPKAPGPIGAVATAKDFFKIVRELSFDEVKQEAEQTPSLLVLAPDDLTASRVGSLLVGAGAVHRPPTAALFAHLPSLDRFDAIVVFDPTNTGRTEELQKRLRAEERPAPVVRFASDRADDERAAARVRAKIIASSLKRAPAFGRAYPAFREAAVKAVLDETAQVNGQFALVSNIPSLVPIVGGLFAAGADILVLTKNQLLLLYKIAAIHGKPLDNRKAFLHEMLSVVGASMLWRTVARQLTLFLPFAAGTIPKVIVAFAGTVVVGRIADYYYRFGHRPNRETILGFYSQAVDAAKRIRLPGRTNGSTDQPGEAVLPDGARDGKDETWKAS